MDELLCAFIIFGIVLAIYLYVSSSDSQSKQVSITDTGIYTSNFVGSRENYNPKCCPYMFDEKVFHLTGQPYAMRNAHRIF